MLFGRNHHYPHVFFNNHTRIIEEKEMLLLNSIHTRFATDLILIMHTLRLKNALRETVNLQEFILLKLVKEEGTFAMIKVDQSFHQRHIFIKMEKPLLILLNMDNSNQPHTDKLQFVVLLVHYHIRISMPKLNDEDYFPSVSELEDDEYEEGPGDYYPSEYVSED